jgi:hypothetical protein
MDARTEFPIQHTPKIGFLIAAVPLVFAVGLAVAGGVTGMWPLQVVALVPLAVGAFLLYKAIAMNRMTIRFEPDALVIDIPLDQHRLAYGELVRDQARLVDLDRQPELAPKKRVNGADLANLRQGWFQLRNGEKALLVVTDPHHVVYIPTTKGYSLLMSPPEPARFLEILNDPSWISAPAPDLPVARVVEP